MSFAIPGPSMERPRRSNARTQWTSRLPIQRAAFDKLTSMRHFFYSTQFLRSGVPLTIWNAVLLGERKKSIREAKYLKIETGIWHLFRCCIEVYDDHGNGLIGSSGFWIMVWSRLQRLRQLNDDDFTIYKYLPHIVHFYAKSRELGLRTFFQTYWNPYTGVGNQLPRRQASIVDDEYWYENHENWLRDRENRKVSSDREISDVSPEKLNDDIPRDNPAPVETSSIQNASCIQDGVNTDPSGNSIVVSNEEPDPVEEPGDKAQHSHGSTEREPGQVSEDSSETSTPSEAITIVTSDEKPESIISASSRFKKKRKGGPVLIGIGACKRCTIW
ncbi:hypothetical protein F5B19DRAFT_505589 [Rostrohypoxylon terebratum]|nr:hypothetical protein F5B19DRAFT_505589 [Rostrohypoxylon terebratum]